MSESRLQQACVKWFKYLPNVPNELLIAIPNEGKRSFQTASRMKAEGMVTGVSDLILFHPAAKRKPIFLECKLPMKKQSPHQKNFEEIITACGYRYFVFYSIDDFMTIVSNYLELNPVLKN